MTLEQRYNDAAANTYVGRVRTRQAAGSTETNGVDFMDGQPKLSTSPEDAYQTEFKRNPAGAFKYGAPGQNNLLPGTDASTEATGAPIGLSRWTANALNIAFSAASTGLQSRWVKYRGFKSASPTKWVDPTTNQSYSYYHRWDPTGNFVNALPNTVPAGQSGLSTQARVKTTPKGPSPL